MDKNVLIAGAVLIAVILIWLIISYKSFKRMADSVKEAFYTIESHLSKRYKLAIDLEKTVKRYAPQEEELLYETIAAANQALRAQNMQDKVMEENDFSQAIDSLLEACGNYPQLQANGNFANLQKKLLAAGIEISNAKKFYNVIAKMLNQRVTTLPSNIIAKMFRFQKQPMFRNI